jgi:glyoxylase-like metal-dependent hydrolase (beta-lactamase superfamily II)
MKKIILKLRIFNQVCLVIALIIAFCPVQTAFADGLTKIADNVYGYADIRPMSPQNSFAANTGVIIGENGIVVIDSLVSAKEAQRFIRDIRAISDKPIKYVVNTHYHLDHALGNSEFAKLGATIISQDVENENARKAGEAILKGTKDFGLTEQDMEGTTTIFPELNFSDRLEIDLGDQRIELIYPGPSHTAGSILVYLPDKKILFAGDILFTGYHPFIADGNISGWLGVLDLIQAMDAVQIIPGHGPVSTKQDIADMKNYLTVFDEKATELCAQSQDAAYIFSELKKALPQRDGEMLIMGNLQMRYLHK